MLYTERRQRPAATRATTVRSSACWSGRRTTTRRTTSRRPARARRITALAAGAEVDNPYFNVNKNKINTKNNRIIANLGVHVHAVLVGQPQDATSARRLHEPEPDPAASGERAAASRNGGILDQADDITRNINVADAAQLQQPSARRSSLSISGFVGNAISDQQVDASMRWRARTSSIRTSSRSTTRRPQSSRTTIAQRRLVSALRPGDARLQATTCT